MTLQSGYSPWSELGELPTKINMASFLVERASTAPGDLAIRIAQTKTLASGASHATFEDTTFAELNRTSGELACGLTWAGVERGAHVCLFVRPGVELIALVFSLMRIGAVPVLIDPGMGTKNVLSCVQRMRPDVFIGIPIAHGMRRLRPDSFRSVKLDIVASGKGSRAITRLSRSRHIDDVQADGRGKNAALLETSRDDKAAILFTSGSTGPPKGVVYTHGMFEAQMRALKAMYAIQPGEVDVACLPVFALFGPALGITSVFPELDPSKPGTSDPAKVVAAIKASSATTTFGSPAIWHRVIPYCIKHDIKLPSLRRVLIAGAPVPAALIAEFHLVLGPDADVHTPYGATECLPVSSGAGRDLSSVKAGSLRARAESGSGTCVGRVAPGIELALIDISDEPFGSLDPAESNSTCRPATRINIIPGTQSRMGEIIVRGPAATREYQFDPAHTLGAKIPVAATDAHDLAETWHRIGDMGYIDEAGRLWFCGRKSHRLQTVHGTVAPVPIENIFNTHAAIFRSALVGIGEPGAERPVLIVQLEPKMRACAKLANEIFAHAAGHALTRRVEAILFKPNFPVDVRHNAKIHRGELKAWAMRKAKRACFARKSQT